MNKRTKFGLVLGGYAVACLTAGGVAYLNQLIQGDTSQASAGMSAFGDFVLFLGTFGVLALFPTGLALYFLFRQFLRR